MGLGPLGYGPTNHGSNSVDGSGSKEVKQFIIENEEMSSVTSIRAFGGIFFHRFCNGVSSRYPNPLLFHSMHIYIYIYTRTYIYIYISSHSIKFDIHEFGKFLKKWFWAYFHSFQGMAFWATTYHLRLQYRLHGVESFKWDVAVMGSGPFGPFLLSAWAGVLAK